jgi:hypothetical protein
MRALSSRWESDATTTPVLPAEYKAEVVELIRSTGKTVGTGLIASMGTVGDALGNAVASPAPAASPTRPRKRENSSSALFPHKWGPSALSGSGWVAHAGVACM